MRRKFLLTVALVTLCFTSLVFTLGSSQAQLAPRGFETPARANTSTVPPNSSLEEALPRTCALQPDPRQTNPPTWVLQQRRSISLVPGAVSLSRFRQVPDNNATPGAQSATVLTQPSPEFTPREEIALIDPTNYGDRFLQDLQGNPALLEPIVVLHETVGSASSALNLFRTPHPRDADQASYHTLIALDGTIIYLVPPDKRAFGAGNSAFVGLNGVESIQTNPKLAGSVNNFAYHISLETPPSGNNNARRHTGYTPAQYQSLAWLVAKTGVPDARITTHQAVDRSGQRLDPRSFDFSNFLNLLQQYPRTPEISIQCLPPADPAGVGQSG
ncbi:N-acetylmuramoyl-L-alanine amidase [Pantanalinema sp. GBBB05]|uniref:N-acetylmuramoyl-L-alanine amidase n=1 Tax=Pantanalinema sp. GBBB05 TaxID=2604139 RepID=UPI001DCCF2A7|nr:N-acetylmuramoyl-L-alanine amidase [Pantanalinema sp. GBBB05]